MGDERTENEVHPTGQLTIVNPYRNNTPPPPPLNIRHATSGRDAMERVAKSDRDLKKQGVWVQQQAKAREQRRQRANHMLEASLFLLFSRNFSFAKQYRNIYAETVLIAWG